MFEPMPDETARHRCMEFVMEAGSTLLENGGEVFRVQQTMYIMARALHLREFTVYVLSNGIFATAGASEISALRHVPSCSIHLGRVTALNELSRDLAQGKVSDILEAELRLAAVRAIPESPPLAQIAASATGAAFFGMLFGGTPLDGAAAAAAGLVLAVFLQAAGRWGLNGLFARLLGSALVVLIGQGAGALLPAVTPDSAIIGALFVMTPGVSFTTGVRDLVHGDYLSGTIRLIDAILTAGAMACGVFVAYGLPGWLGGVLQ